MKKNLFKKIIILSILGYFIFLKHQEWTSMNNKILHTSRGCEILCQYVEKFGYLMEKKFEKETDLRMPSSGILLKDAWGNPFQIDINNFKFFQKVQIKFPIPMMTSFNIIAS